MLILPKYNNFQQERQVGEYTILLPDPPNLNLIGNKGLPKDKQMFVPTILPKDIAKWERKGREDFEDKEFEKRFNGYWFWNNGNLEWVSGTHYFYINWYYIDIGLPSFVDSDRDWFYMWWYVQNNPKAKGFINLENRRGGKSWRGLCCMYEATSNPRYENKISTIQSKTDDDARKLFKRLVFSWKKMPYFFKPIDVGISNPTAMLEFAEPSKRDTKSQEKDYRDVLNSVVDFAPSGEEALDGTKQFVCYQDEIGKTKRINVNKRIQIVSECVVDGTDIVGKIIATTTVEEMEKGGGKHCKEVWDGASPSQLLPNGETQNGLLRYFKPADFGYRGADETNIPFIDRYGYSDRTRAKQFIENKVNSIIKREDKNSYKRKYPLTIKDCWLSDAQKSVYDTDKIDEQMQYNETLPSNILVRGNFVWAGGIVGTEVEWHPCVDGRWLLAWMPDIHSRNKSVIKFGRKSPANTEMGCFGLDPYDNKTTVDDRKSDAASYGFRKFDPMIPNDSGIFISEYVNRPSLPEIMWEDMIMQCVFYGWEILIESNKIGTINYFRMKGYGNYLMARPEETQTNSSSKMEEPGIPMSGIEARQSLVYATESYIINKVGIIKEEGKDSRIGKCYFDKLLENWKAFDFDDEWTKYDSMVGAGLALLGARKYIPKKHEYKHIQLYKKYNNKGVTGQEVK